MKASYAKFPLDGVSMKQPSPLLSAHSSASFACSYESETAKGRRDGQTDVEKKNKLILGRPLFVQPKQKCFDQKTPKEIKKRKRRSARTTDMNGEAVKDVKSNQTHTNLVTLLWSTTGARFTQFSTLLTRKVSTIFLRHF